MSADEDKTEAIVLDLLIHLLCFTEARLQVVSNVFLCSIEARATAHCVDGLEACRGNQPGARLVRNARLRPRLQCGSERLVHRLFGQVQVTEQSYERRRYPARFGSVKGLNGSTNRALSCILFGREDRRQHDVR